MSAGLGILLAAVVAVVAWQLDKRNAWAALGRLALRSLLALAVVIAGISAWVWWDDRAGERTNRRLADEIRTNGPSQYWGLQLGSTKANALYLKGEPSSRDDLGKKSWFYRTTEDGSRAIHVLQWDGDEKLKAVTCLLGQPFECESVAGVSVGTSEEDVVAYLGSPAKTSEPTADGLKVLFFGVPDARLAIGLRQGRVESLSFHRPGAAEPVRFPVPMPQSGPLAEPKLHPFSNWNSQPRKFGP